MVTPIRSRASAASRFDSEEIRRLVQLGKDRGLIHAGAVPVAKNGEDAARLGELRSQWMDVDPATAKRWLENNFRNRPLKEDVVKAYARDMINKVWVPTHQGVAFNDRDELIDGQHRLNAIILSGETIRMMVTFGLPSQIEGKEMTTMDAVDRGRTRSVADQLRIQHGMKDGSVIAAISSALGGICCGERTRRLSVGQTLDIYRAFQPAVDWIIAHRSRQHGLRTTGVLAGFAFAIAAEGGIEDGSTPVSLMFEKLTGGDDLEPSSALGRLRDFLTSPEAKLITRSFDRGLAELVLQAIHLQLEGTAVEKLEMALDGVNHFRGQQKARVQQVAAIFQLPTTKTNP